MEYYKCLLCGKDFLRWLNRTRKTPKFCSKKCYRNAPRSWIQPIEASKEVKIERVRKTYEKLVIKQDGCWGWKGAVTNFGYGKTTKYFKLWTAHRASWFLNHGQIPEDKCVLHICDNPICSNPDHLFLGDKKINNKDRHKKIRDAKGSNNGNSKLDEKKVKKIKIMLKKGFSQAIIAEKFEIYQTTISKIKLGQIWRHVTC